MSVVNRLRRGEEAGVDGWWNTMGEAADEIERLRDALAACAAPFDSGPTTVMGGFFLAAEELKRRIQIAGDALTK